MVKGRQGERVRLYVRGTILGYKRSKSNQYPNTSLIQIEGVNTQEERRGTRGSEWRIFTRPRLRRMVLTTVAFGEKSLVLTETVASFVPSSSRIFLPNQWELEFGFSCIRATFEVKSQTF
ncbi:UNVERIFIED_CONTAM: 60S ribosomal protein L35a-3 [Sesamum radiatum]|uniref:60S ribosomal protein L35a-3 n=1 Tax=Sesamum radiatum TaxID=300843 RepID=A0AAW2TFV1_SESRA